MLPDYVQGKLADLFRGHDVAVGHRELDMLSEHLQDDDTPEARRYFHELVTVPNPEQYGWRDTFVAHLRNREPELLARMREGGAFGLTSEQVDRLRSYKLGQPLPTDVELEELVVKPAHDGWHTVFLFVKKHGTRYACGDRQALVYCNALNQWTVDLLESPMRPFDSSCDTRWKEADAIEAARAFVFEPRDQAVCNPETAPTNSEVHPHDFGFRGVTSALPRMLQPHLARDAWWLANAAITGTLATELYPVVRETSGLRWTKGRALKLALETAERAGFNVGLLRGSMKLKAAALQELLVTQGKAAWIDVKLGRRFDLHNYTMLEEGSHA